MKDNKAFQTIVGAATLYVAFVLWRDGWFTAFAGQESEGFSGPELWASVFAAVLSFVQLVGLFTIGIVSGILPHLDGLFSLVATGAKKAGAWAKNTLPKLLGAGKTALGNVKTPGDGPDWNWKPFVAVILLWWAYNNGMLDKVIDVVKGIVTPEEVIVDGDVAAVLFSVHPSMTPGQSTVTTSTKVDDMLIAAGVERRRLNSTQGAEGAEPWLRLAVEAAPDDRASMVVISEKLKVLEIPETIQGMENVVKTF